MLRDGIERFPTAFVDPRAMEIRLLSDHREALVIERNRLTNRLRWNLVVPPPELEAEVPARKLDYPWQLKRITRRPRAMPQTARVRVALDQTKRTGALAREAEALKRELWELVKLHNPRVLAETGCGPHTAAILIGQTAGAESFATDAKHRHLERRVGRARRVWPKG